MKSALSFLAALALAALCLLLLGLALRHHQAAPFLACLAIAVLCIDGLAVLLRGAWISAAGAVTALYAVAAEFLLLIIPSVRGVSWVEQTGFEGMEPAIAAGVAVAISLPLVAATIVLTWDRWH